MNAQSQTESASFVTSFARGLRVIEAFTHDKHSMTLAEVAQRTELDRAVARRLLLTLAELGMVRMVGRQFELTPSILRLGFTYLGAMGLDERMKPELDCLSIALHEAVSIGVLDGNEVILVARSEAAARPFTYAPHIGSRLPALFSSSGRVLLAMQEGFDIDALLEQQTEQFASPPKSFHRDKVRQILADARVKGYALNVEETIEGLLSLSIPLWGRNGAVRAALNVSSHTSRTTPDQMIESLLPQMRIAAARMTALLN